MISVISAFLFFKKNVKDHLRRSSSVQSRAESSVLNVAQRSVRSVVQCPTKKRTQCLVDPRPDPNHSWWPCLLMMVKHKNIELLSISNKNIFSFLYFYRDERNEIQCTFISFSLSFVSHVYPPSNIFLAHYLILCTPPHFPLLFYDNIHKNKLYEWPPQSVCIEINHQEIIFQSNDDFVFIKKS